MPSSSSLSLADLVPFSSTTTSLRRRTKLSSLLASSKALCVRSSINSSGEGDHSIAIEWMIRGSLLGWFSDDKDQLASAWGSEAIVLINLIGWSQRGTQGLGTAAFTEAGRCYWDWLCEETLKWVYLVRSENLEWFTHTLWGPAWESESMRRDAGPMAIQL